VAVFDLRTRRTRYLRDGRHPRWSRDGRRLVFVRGTYGAKARSRIYAMNDDGSGLTQLTR
jgi:Tol biopolymer transport system component